MEQVKLSEAKSWLYQLVSGQLGDHATQWFLQQAEALESEGPGRKLFLAFSSAPRFAGKKRLNLSDQEYELAQQIRRELQPQYWTIDQAIRIYFMLLLPTTSAAEHKKWIMELFDTADMGEQAAIFASLPLLPYPEQYRDLAAEGVRTNMTVVLESIGLSNPYPADYMEDNAWNQLFLKCVFTDRALYKIVGIKRRANAELARIISDYAHERWAAGREVAPGIWQPVPDFFQETHLGDMKKLFQHPEPLQQLAAALTCYESEHNEAAKLLEKYPDLKQNLVEENIDWKHIGEKWEMKFHE